MLNTVISSLFIILENQYLYQKERNKNIKTHLHNYKSDCEKLTDVNWKVNEVKFEGRAL